MKILWLISTVLLLGCKQVNDLNEQINNANPLTKIVEENTTPNTNLTPEQKQALEDRVTFAKLEKEALRHGINCWSHRKEECEDLLATIEKSETLPAVLRRLKQENFYIFAEDKFLRGQSVIIVDSNAQEQEILEFLLLNIQ